MANILIIDWDVMEAFLEETALEFEGHDVRLETDGARGLELIKEGWPNLVILDPRHDIGVEAIDRARAASGAHARIPLLLVSNPHQGAGSGDVDRADDRLDHPFTVPELQQKVDSLLAP